MQIMCYNGFYGAEVNVCCMAALFLGFLTFSGPQYAALAAPNPPPSSARNHGKSVKADPSLGLSKADVSDVGAKNRVGGCWGYV